MCGYCYARLIATEGRLAQAEWQSHIEMTEEVDSTSVVLRKLQLVLPRACYFGPPLRPAKVSTVAWLCYMYLNNLYDVLLLGKAVEIHLYTTVGNTSRSRAS